MSFASKGREDYHSKLLRLMSSVATYWPGDWLVYSPDFPDSTNYIRSGYPQPKSIRSYTHHEMPYQFKTAVIQEAIEKGYERVVWLDSGMIIQKDITPLFSKKYGVTVFHNLGHPLKNYLADHAWELLGKPDLEKIPQIWGGALFFDFANQNAVEVFEKIKEFSLNGSFKDGGSTREGFVAHRHDQAVMSVLVYGKCDMLPYGKIVHPPHDETFEYGDDFYLVSK